MKKSLISLLVLLIVGSALASPALAGKKKKKVKKPARVERTVNAVYQLPGFGTPTGSVGCSPALGSCGNFAIGADEKYAKITLTDSTGTPTAFTVSQDTEPGDTTNNIETTHGVFCGTTGDEPIEILPGYEMTVFIWAWGDIVCPDGVGTTGSIEATFSNLP